VLVGSENAIPEVSEALKGEGEVGDSKNETSSVSLIIIFCAENAPGINSASSWMAFNGALIPFSAKTKSSLFCLSQLQIPYFP